MHQGSRALTCSVVTIFEHEHEYLQKLPLSRRISDKNSTCVHAGATNIIESVARSGGDNFERVVLTSSTSAISPSVQPTGTAYSESDWNTASTLENGVYGFSKVRLSPYEIAEQPSDAK